MRARSMPSLVLLVLIALSLTGCGGNTAQTLAPATAAARTNAPAVAPTNAAAAAATGAPTASAADAAGSNSAVRLAVDPQNTQAHFRAREQLANKSLPSDAIGTTNQVSGSVDLAADGSVADGSKITVKVDSLATTTRVATTSLKKTHSRRSATRRSTSFRRLCAASYGLCPTQARRPFSWMVN